MTADYLREKYGDKVKVQFHDMSKQEESDAAPEVTEAVREKNIPYPLTAINGEFRLAGAVDFWRISNIIDELLKPASV